MKTLLSFPWFIILLLLGETFLKRKFLKPIRFTTQPYYISVFHSFIFFSKFSFFLNFQGFSEPGFFGVYNQSRGIWDWLWFSGGMAPCGRGLIAIFRSFFLVLTKFSFFQGGWALPYHSRKFRVFPNISLFPKILSLKLFVYTMFISNNRASFHLWWKENLVKH